MLKLLFCFFQWENKRLNLQMVNNIFLKFVISDTNFKYQALKL